jgi:iron complex transport system substrate-binding protein
VISQATWRRAGVALALAAAACGCSPGRFGHTLGPGPRIVSLAPSLTEIAFAIGCGGRLVGDTSFDDYPPAAAALPHVADLSHVDLERLAALAPTAVLALHDQEAEGAAVTMRLGITVRYLPNRGLDDLWADIAGVGEACRMQPQARELSARLRRRLAAMARRVRGYSGRPRIFVLLGLPGFTAGRTSFINDMLQRAGALNVAGSIDLPYPDVSPEWLLRSNPDAIIVACDVGFTAGVRAEEPWRSLRAVRAGRVYEPPSDDILERNGPRIVDGIAWIMHVVHGSAPPSVGRAETGPARDRRCLSG